MAEPTTPPGKTDIQALVAEQELPKPSRIGVWPGDPSYYTEPQLRAFGRQCVDAALALLRAEGEQTPRYMCPLHGAQFCTCPQLLMKQSELRALSPEARQKLVDMVLAAGRGDAPTPPTEGEQP